MPPEIPSELHLEMPFEMSPDMHLEMHFEISPELHLEIHFEISTNNDTCAWTPNSARCLGFRY